MTNETNHPTVPVDPTHLLTTFEAAKMLQITYPTLTRWFKNGWIRYIEYPNKRKYVPLSEIQRIQTEGQRR